MLLRPANTRTVFLVASLLVLTLAAVAAPVFAQSAPGSIPLDPINSIPTPAPITIRPRLFTAYGTLIAAAMFSVLYLYRSRAFILYWLGSLLLLTTALAITSAINDAAPGTLMNGGALLSLTLSAGLLKLAADAFPGHHVRWSRPLKVGGLLTIWAFVAPAIVPFRMFVNTSLLTTAGLLGWAAIRYFTIARRRHHVGALIIAVGLAIVSAGVATGVLVAVGVTPDPGLVNRVAAINVITSLFVALGMLLLVFEELTDELRRANRDLAFASEVARRLATTDALTGCHNRRFFEEIERREINRHRRYGVPLSVVFIDVNRLKRLNDSLGHERGDDALRAIGAMLRREVRESDYVIRWGGDEFLLLLACPAAVARNKAASLKRTFVIDQETADFAPHIGLSMGVATVAPDAENLHDAIREADALMYQDKLGEATSLQVR